MFMRDNPSIAEHLPCSLLTSMVIRCFKRHDPLLTASAIVGVVLAGESSTTKSSHLVSDIVWAVTAVVSIGAGWYIWWKMSKVRIEVWREMRYVDILRWGTSLNKWFAQRGVGAQGRCR